MTVDRDEARCESCGQTYPRREGIWRFLPEAREKAFAVFLREYRVVRESEGWGAPAPDYYRSLPHVAVDDPRRAIWRIRAKSFRRFLRWIADDRCLKILDVGAGNGWLSNQLARRGHALAAVDVSNDARDGLGAWTNYEAHFGCYQSEFDHLPFDDAQFDVVIFNASLHYAADPVAPLREASRVLAQPGRIVVIDSPFYSTTAGGEAMIREREAGFARQLGFEREVRLSGYFVESGLRHAAESAGLTVRMGFADDSWPKRLRRMWMQFRAGREPARLPMIILKKSGADTRELRQL